MARYIDADLLYKETEKKIKANHEKTLKGDTLSSMVVYQIEQIENDIIKECLK